MAEPLSLPQDYNPETFMLAKTTEYGLFHESRKAARLAAELVANGTAQDLVLAEKVLDATLACQELDQRDPHYGNFYWMREDAVVEDLNAVEFVLEALIPMMLRHGDRLAPDLRGQVRARIRLGLDEIRRLDVLVAYSNITILDILNTALGGELLADEAIAQRGYDKLVAWMDYTNRSGLPFEYNSPTYTAVTLRALKQLADLIQHQPTRIRARTMAARLGLSVALHIHNGTGRWAGPHSRAYHPSVVGETPPEIEMVRDWIGDGTVPGWVAEALTQRPTALQVTETAERARRFGLTTYHSRSFALGTGSKNYGGQANAFIVHYKRPIQESDDRPGVLYSRYILDDKWLGDFYHATDRTKSRNLVDEGDFCAVQEGPRTLGVYSPADLDQCRSAKAALIWVRRAQIDAIWIGDELVTQLPAPVPPGQVVVVASGEALMAVRPLTITALGQETPVRLVDRDGDLVLEMVNYPGPEKRFWELRWPGAFYKGRPFCAFYAEVAERNQHPDGSAFGRAVAAGEFEETLADPFTYAGEEERRYTAAYRRDGWEIGLTIDLMAWTLQRRWTEKGDLGWPMLESPVARQNASGHIEIGHAELTCDPAPAWLWGSPEIGRWVAGYLGTAPTTLTLTTPQGSVSVRNMGTGTVVWDNGEVDVEAIGEYVVTKE